MEKLNLNDCILVRVNSSSDLENFSCGDDDLDEFFSKDAWSYTKQLLGKTYFFVTNSDSPQIIGAFTVANDSIKASLISKSTKNRLQRKIPNSKRTRSYPAVLIGRLGVSADMKGRDIGSDILSYIKAWFAEINNKSGCRYVVVDAYNKPSVLNFYERNDFKYLYATEEEERQTFGLSEEEHLNSRMMYFDLINYSEL